uniref:Uncharacterized protein n=1 Tax=Arundo donax TaxID=35708 RepID=A0A0A8ZKR3_ARUDO
MDLSLHILIAASATARLACAGDLRD